MEEVTVVDGLSSEDDKVDDVDEEEEQEWDDLETDTEEDDVQIQYHSSGEDSKSEDDDSCNNEDDVWEVHMKFWCVTTLFFFNNQLGYVLLFFLELILCNVLYSFTVCVSCTLTSNVGVTCLPL